ncbi:Membrane metalloprotease ARASP [Hibiscus syriacus]|uniref:Membrane metalloprotease ARASP n=1 Tax=Hibiscus syriacus TaxID=106335 RepID=A0A6A2X9S8_HIBSY|nr:probable membrane metalloprotease ARASP2, chloroplastic [Hibiscus syriacus]KAE8666030.1 Membrane metalloprotease ARASP [Hibiscus syriacus]
MLINFSSLSSTCPTSFSSSTYFPSRLYTSRPPYSEFPFKPRTHLVKSPSLSVSHSSKNKLLSRTDRIDFRSRALPGLDFGNVESVLEAAGVLTAIIVVHETGHFLAAYLQGIRVSKFAVGFGPILAKFNANDVEFSLRAVPLGGFVGFPDNDPDSDIPEDDENLLKNRPILDRVIVISAGVVANIVFAYAIIFTQVLSVGLPMQEPFSGVLVPDVRPFSAASRDGLLPGDVILAVNGIELQKTGPSVVSQVVDIIKKNPKRNVFLKVERAKQDFEIGVVPDENFDGSGKIGVQLSPNIKITKLRPNNIFEAFNYTGKEFWGLTYNVLDSLKQTFMNFSQSASKVSGPVAIIAVGAEVARSTVDGLYEFAALLNLNLAVINLLPLPALDGGSLALVLLEAARGGRKLPLELEQRIMSSGIMLVLLLGLFLIVRDTLNLEFIKDLL